jgi:glycosyltransferase involved in cell wall biosynthesis
MSPADRGAAALLAFYFAPENTSGVQRATRLYRYLPEFGYRTHVVCSSHAGTAQMERVLHVPDPATMATSAARQSALAARLQRAVLPYDERLPWAPHAVAAVGELIREAGVSTVISTSPPVAPHMAAWWLKRKYGVRWVADFRDPILGNPGRPRRWARPYDIALERMIFSAADAVVAVTEPIAARWRKSHPRWAYKFHVIWNGFDPEEQFGPLPIPPAGRRVLLHAGVLYFQRHPFGVFDSLDRLIQGGRLDPASFVLRFTGILQKREDLLARQSVRRLLEQGCLEMEGVNVPREEAMRQIATADWLFLIDIVNADGAGYTVPAKIFDYILTGRPVLAITDRDSPVDMILNGSGVPVATLYHDDAEAAVDDKLLKLFSFPSEPVKPSDWFFEQFDGRRQAGRLAQILDQLGS